MFMMHTNCMTSLHSLGRFGYRRSVHDTAEIHHQILERIAAILQLLALPCALRASLLLLFRHGCGQLLEPFRDAALLTVARSLQLAEHARIRLRGAEPCRTDRLVRGLEALPRGDKELTLVLELIRRNWRFLVYGRELTFRANRVLIDLILSTGAHRLNVRVAPRAARL
eukprot:scaffold9689_cov116-Isochrysis_galbana.AAC.9